MKKLLNKKVVYVLGVTLLMFLFFRVGFLSKLTLNILTCLSEFTAAKFDIYEDIESKLQQLPLGISKKEVLQKMKPYAPTMKIDGQDREYWSFPCPSGASVFNECRFDPNTGKLNFVSSRGDYYKMYENKW